ncbi:hypothetical protein PCANB_000426 [Pneumocystis canis]|nr:hypothetical protein PCANB_000426 [Pneumocystis canis]
MNNQEFLCQFCNNHHGKYLCPRCKQRYCSLTCYRNQTHLGCSEFFYKNNIEQEIKNKKVSQEEKTRMLKFLSEFRYNKNNIENSEFLYNNEELLEEEQDDLKDRMKDINIENASFEEIWERLNSSERNEFVHLALAYNEDE